MLSFKLSDDFIREYSTKKPEWGFTDAGGNSLGELTFIAKYSRLKDDGTKERWYEVCRRVIEGMFSIQKDHVKTNRLPWNDNKAQRSAQEAFERMFAFKWTPPGRGLWVMGTPIVNEFKNSAALQNPMVGETRVVTSEGVRTLAELVGQEFWAWLDGAWQSATVNDMGVQPVQRITFAPFSVRSNVRVIETATLDHGWVLRDGSKTHSLTLGDVVGADAVNADVFSSPDFKAGFRHGFVFGDGSAGYRYANGDTSFSVRLCGAKADLEVAGEPLLKLFDTHSYQPNCDGDPVCYVRTAVDLKALPVSDSAPYLAGFIRGWLAADGSQTKTSIVLSTQDAVAAEWIAGNATLGGYIAVGHSVSNVATNYGERSAPLHKITLTDPTDKGWKVVSIELLDEPEQVFCPFVPSVGAFTLASGLTSSNCAFISTADMTKTDPAYPFAFLMEASMLGIGVGFDDKGADKDFPIYGPSAEKAWTYQIPDTREGWVEAMKLTLESYLMPNRGEVTFDYSLVRPEGAPIATFGGTAAGPAPLERLVGHIKTMFFLRAGEKLTRRDIADIGNMIGVCVVSGNVRRSAELLMGRLDDKDFIELKNFGIMDTKTWQYTEKGPAYDRRDWGWMSNNSVEAHVGADLSHIIDGIAHNGEPGVLWMDVSRKYGRLADPVNNKDWRIAGYNPCAEQSLESGECCTLVETYLNRHDSVEDFKRTLKFAYLYAKTVTLMPTHWDRTNAIMQRNRRIGTSMAGVSTFVDTKGLPVLKDWLNAGYEEIQRYDVAYSEWLCIRESIKTTTIKPGGTVPLLAGETPGAHWSPGGEYYFRTQRFKINHPVAKQAIFRGYRVELELNDPDNTVVVYFPIRSKARRSEADVSVYEKINLAAFLQRYWSDNSVSVTVSFDPATEAGDIGTVLNMYDGQLKTVSFLPMDNGSYAQMPYTKMTADEYDEQSLQLFPFDMDALYDNSDLGDAEGEEFCVTDGCLVPVARTEEA